MTIEELKVKFTADSADLRAKTNEIKKKFSDVSKISDQMQKTIDRGMKSSSEKTQKLAKSLPSLGEKLNAQSEKIRDAASNVDYYADRIEQLKEKYQSRTDEVSKQQTKVAALESTYAKVKEAVSQFGSKIPLNEQLEEAGAKVDRILNEINTLKKALSETPKVGIVDLPDTIMSIEDAKSKVSLLIKEYQEASNVADSLHNAISSIGKENIKFTSNEGMKELNREISSAKSELSSLQSKANQTNSEISSTAQKAANSYKQLSSASSVFDGIKSKIDQTESKLKSATSFTSRFKERLGQIRAGTIEKVQSGFKSAGSAISKVGGAIRSIPSHLKNIGTHAKSSTNQLGKLPSTLKKIGVAAAALTLVRSVFGKLRSVISNYISQNDKLNARVEGMKNAFGKLLAPAIEIVVSAFEKLMPYLLAIGDAIMNVLSSLSIFSGLKKTSSAIDGVTASTNALSKAQNELYGFDKITKQNDDTGSSGSNPAATKYQAADIGSIDDIISRLTSSINQALSSINWESIQQKASSFAQKTGEALNNLFGGIDWELVGSTFGNGLNTVTNTINTFVDTVKWNDIGSDFAKSLNSMVDTVDFEALGKTLSVKLKILTETLKGFFTDFDFKDLGNGIGTSINSFFDNINWGDVASNISSSVAGIFDTISATLQTINWHGLAKKTEDFIKNIDWGKMASALFEALGSALGGLGAYIGTLLSDAWKSFTNYWDKYIDWGDAPENIIAGLWQGIKDALSNIGNWIKENIFQPFINGFKAAFGIHSPSTVMAELGSYLIEGLKKGIGDIWAKVEEKFTGLLTSITNWFSKKKENIKQGWENFTSDIKDKTVSFVGQFKEDSKAKLSDLKTKWNTLKSGTIKKTGQFKEDTKAKLSNLKTKWNTLKSGIITKTGQFKEDTKAKLSDLKSKWDSISSKTAILTATFKDNITSFFNKAMQNICDIINKLVDYINKVLPEKWELPHVTAPKLAKGGIVDRPTFAEIGEAGKEAVMPLENNTGWIDELARRIAMMIGSFYPSSSRGSGSITIPIYIGSKKITEVVIDDVNKITTSTGRCPIKI